MNSQPTQESAPVAVDYDPFAHGALAISAPSTESQRELWLADKLSQGASLAYNESVSLHLRGPLDVSALHSALQQLLDRHDALRATFSTDGETLNIAEHAALHYEFRDLSVLDAAARDAEIQKALVRVVETPFDLEHGPLIRTELFCLCANEYLLILTAHHIVCDGWSYGVIVRDLAGLYRHALGGETLPASESFAHFAKEQAAHIDSEIHRADEKYWLTRYASPPTALDLPLDHTRPRRRTFASRREDHVLPADLVATVKRTGARAGASLYASLLAAFSVLLNRLTGQDDLAIGIPAAGQAVGGHLNLVGHCVNVLPLRIEIDTTAGFDALLGAVRAQVLDAFEHQQYTLGTLLKHLSLPRDASRLPVTCVLFNLDQALDESSIEFPQLTFEFRSVPRTFENFELFVNAVQIGGAIRLECQYNSDLFNAATIRSWLDAYETLLRAIVADTSTRIANLPLVSARSLDALRRLQPAPTPFEHDVRVSDLFTRQARSTPEKVAVRFGDTSWTYATLAQQASAIAQTLHDQNVGSGALVGICLQRSPQMIAAILGVLEAGAAYVPLDPAYPKERLDFMAKDAELSLLLSESSHGVTLDWPAQKTLLLDQPGALVRRSSAVNVKETDSGSAGETPAYVIYTSGSTGKPKGVCVPHRAVVNFLDSMRLAPGLSADDKLLAVTSLSFDIAVLELFLPLTTGAQIVLASREQTLDGHALVDMLRTSGANVMQATPATWRLLIEAGWNGHANFKALCGGEALAVDLAAQLLQRCAALWNMYGPTETTVWSTCDRVASTQSGISIGTPIANTQVWVLDTQLQPCPLGVPGEIFIGGDGVTLGYLHRPELNAERFIADPFSAKAGTLLYRTGDRGRWRSDRLLEHLGRLDFQVKLRGFRIELGEIEATLVAQAEVARAVVVTTEIQPGDVRLIAYLVAKPGTSIDETTLRKNLRKTLPDYMVPQYFVAVPAIPLLPNGKIDRKSLPTPFARVAMPTTQYIAPRDETERRVAAAMEQTLALPEISVDADFFALGGHSLLAAQLATRLSREFNVVLSLRTLFDAPTIAGLAQAVQAAAVDGESMDARKITPLADRSSAPLSLLQKRLWLFEQLNPGSVVFHTPSAHRLRGTLDEVAFERAFNELVQRQPVLRTSIEYDHEDVIQKIHPDISVRLFPAEDLSHLPEVDREKELMRRLDVLTATPFDLTQAPLFRAKMFRLGPSEHALFFMPHHIVWDGWSFDLFYEEFSALYVAFKEGKPSPLSPLAVSYGDFAAWHEQWIQGPAYAAQLQHQVARWRERLARFGAPRALPTDKPHQIGKASKMELKWLTLSQAKAEALRKLGFETNATVFIMLLSAYFVMLYRIIGEGNLVVGTPVRVRLSSDLEKVMGLFTNLLPLALNVEPSMSFPDLVAEVKAVALEELAHPDVQLDDLMHEPGMRELAGTTHFYQAQFSYQDARQRIRDWGGLAQSQIPLSQREGSEDLAIWFLDHGEGMIGAALYNADILNTDSAQAIVDHYMHILDRIIGTPQATVAQLIDVSAAELERIRRNSVAHTPAASEAMTSTAKSATMQETPVLMTPSEQFLAGIWRELLGVDEIVPSDNFFDLGGHSLIAMSMAAQVEKRTGVRLNILRIANGSLRSLAAEIPEAATLNQSDSKTFGKRLRGLFGIGHREN